MSSFISSSAPDPLHLPRLPIRIDQAFDPGHARGSHPSSVCRVPQAALQVPPITRLSLPSSAISVLLQCPTDKWLMMIQSVSPCRRPRSLERDHPPHAGAAVPARKRHLPAPLYRHGRLAHRCHHGRVRLHFFYLHRPLLYLWLTGQGWERSIHERSAREKISSDSVAHVLNDEVSRKYIQSVKRIMTFAQTKYPPDGQSSRSLPLTASQPSNPADLTLSGHTDVSQLMG